MIKKTADDYARDWATPAAYAVEQNGGKPESTLEQTIEIAERYKAALQKIADTGAPRSSGIARAALGQSD